MRTVYTSVWVKGYMMRFRRIINFYFLNFRRSKRRKQKGRSLIWQLKKKAPVDSISEILIQFFWIGAGLGLVGFFFFLFFFNYPSTARVETTHSQNRRAVNIGGEKTGQWCHHFKVILTICNFFKIKAVNVMFVFLVLFLKKKQPLRSASHREKSINWLLYRLENVV